jgi:hypothetical protein
MKYFMIILTVVLLAVGLFAAYLIVEPDIAKAANFDCDLEGKRIYIMDQGYMYYAYVQCPACRVSPCVCRGDLEIWKTRQVSPSTDELIGFMSFACSGKALRLANLACVVEGDNILCYPKANKCMAINFADEIRWVNPDKVDLELKISD